MSTKHWDAPVISPVVFFFLSPVANSSKTAYVFFDSGNDMVCAVCFSEEKKVVESFSEGFVEIPVTEHRLFGFSFFFC